MKGELPDGWKSVKLRGIAELSKNIWKPGDERLPYIGLEHIQENSLRLNGAGDSNEIASNKFIFTENKFLFGRLRPYFRKLYRPEFKGICSTDIWVVRPKNNTDKDFLFYLFANQDFVDMSYKGSSGTRMPRADWNFMVETEWPIPKDENEQKAISSVLSSLDDKIDLLHHQNKTLEAMAETLFRQWFVEEADEGWEEGYFSNFFHLMMGLSPKGNTYNEDGNGVPLLNGAADYNSKYKARKFTSDPKRINKIGDILFCIRATIGNIEIAKEEFCLGRGVAAISPKEEHFRYFVLLHLKRIINELISNASGSVILGLSKDDINNYPILIPPNELLLKFHKKINSVFLKLENNNKQIRTLEKLRDTLLPKLMSGEVRVEYEN